MDNSIIREDEKKPPMGKQETFYRIQITLKQRDFTKKRLELLQKVNFLQDSLKDIGHSGRYGLKGMYCYASKPRYAYCITSIEHEKDIPWLQGAIEKVKTMYREDANKKQVEITDAIHRYEGWTSETRKQKFIDGEFDFERYGISRDNINLNNFVSKLIKWKVDEIYSEGDYLVDELFIEPLKPSKKELQTEEKYTEGLSIQDRGQLHEALVKRFGTPSEWTSWTEILDGKTERAKQMRKNFKGL